MSFSVSSSTSGWAENHREWVSHEDSLVFSFHCHKAEQFLNRKKKNVSLRCGSRIFKVRRNHIRKQAEKSSIVVTDTEMEHPELPSHSMPQGRWRQSADSLLGQPPGTGGIIITGNGRRLSVILEAIEKFCLGY